MRSFGVWAVGVTVSINCQESAHPFCMDLNGRSINHHIPNPSIQQLAPLAREVHRLVLEPSQGAGEAVICRSDETLGKKRFNFR